LLSIITHLYFIIISIIPYQNIVVKANNNNSNTSNNYCY